MQNLKTGIFKSLKLMHIFDRCCAQNTHKPRAKSADSGMSENGWWRARREGFTPLFYARKTSVPATGAELGKRLYYKNQFTPTPLI
ncbi:MAG: hypothetical protein JNM12_14595 [Alphaproteobacteria bacterium]|nr:hypothetical protein [Alphaproteobacteria bacterium]